MKEFTFCLTHGRALLLQDDGIAIDRACFRAENANEGMLVLAGRHFPLSASGAILCARDLKNGIHTPTFFVDGARFEGPPISIGAGSLCFLPPTRAEFVRLTEDFRMLKAAHASLEKRIQSLEAHLQDTNIF